MVDRRVGREIGMDAGNVRYKEGSRNLVHVSFKYGKGVTIGNFCIIEEDVVIGDDVHIGDYVKIPVGSHIGNGCVIGSYVRLGRDCRIGEKVMIKCHAVVSPEVSIGDNSFIGPNAILLHATPDGEHKPSKIGSNCFIGTGVYVNPGVTVGNDIIVGSAAVVTKPIYVRGTYVGVPARLNRTKIRA